MIIGHGDDGYLFENKIVANFSSNVYYNGFPDGMKDHLISTFDTIKNYPEADAQSIVKLIAQFHLLDKSQILVTNGATEAFYLIAHRFKNKSVTIVTPSFSEYEDACQKHNLEVHFIPWEEIHENTQIQTDVLFLGNPNNPTGEIFTVNLLKKILTTNSSTFVVIDEAYADFTDQEISMVKEIEQFSNLIIVKSLTKTYAIPGLRLGYIISNRSSIQHISSFKMPWSVNVMAIEAGKYILKNFSSKPIPIKSLLNDKINLINQIDKIDFVTISPSNTNFFLCKLKKGTASDLKLFLVNEFGILIRDASNFRGLSPQHFRIATQTKEQNKLLIEGLKSWTIDNDF